MAHLDPIEVRRAGLARTLRWHPGFPNEDEWTLGDWGSALAGELGEMLNVGKKIRRVQTGQGRTRHDPSVATLLAKLLEEAADTYLYFDLYLAKLGVEPEQVSRAICDKFNQVSEEEGFPERLSVRGGFYTFTDLSKE